MTVHEMILKEIRSLRKDYDNASAELKSAQENLYNLNNQNQELTKKLESQTFYTAMMTDTLTEVI